MPVISPVHNNKYIKLLLVISIVFFVVMVCAFCLTAYAIVHHPQLHFDSNVFACLQTIRSASMTHVMMVATFLGSRYFLFPCYTVLVVYYLFFRKKLWFAVAIALTGFLGNQLLFFMQDVLHRQRPANPLIDYINGYSYPSGHSFASFTFAGLLSYLIWKKSFKTKWKITVAVISFVIAAIIAISRIYLRVHYPTDVLGGFYLSMIWLIPCLWILYLIDRMYL